MKLKRDPDLIIGDNYLSRWYIIPRNHYFNIYLHKFTGSDDDRALHDHPWWSFSICFKGEMKEHGLNKQRLIPRFLPVIRSARFAHRLEIVQGPVVTLFITGPKIRRGDFIAQRAGFTGRNLLMILVLVLAKDVSSER